MNMRLNEDIARIREIMGWDDLTYLFPIMDEMFRFISDERSDRIEVLIPHSEGEWNLNNWNKGRTIEVMKHFIEKSDNPQLVKFLSEGGNSYDLVYQWVAHSSDGNFYI